MLRLLLCLLLGWTAVSGGFVPARAEQPEVVPLAVQQYGIRVRLPQSWKVVQQARHERAFVVELPAEEDQKAGFVACELGVAPESLKEFQVRIEANDQREQARDAPSRKLIENRLEPLDAERFGQRQADLIERRLVSTWSYPAGPTRPAWRETRVRLISEDTLYTFILSAADEPFKTHQPAFESLLMTAEFSQPQTGLKRLPDGFWLQRQFDFGLQLPPGWKPNFGPHQAALLFATGAKHEVFTDNLIVLARPAGPIDLTALQQTLPAELTKLDPKAEIPQCEIVPQGEGQALETTIHIQRGPFRLTIFERRFAGRARNYEVRFTLETEEFKLTKNELRASMDSFREVEDGP